MSGRHVQSAVGGRVRRLGLPSLGIAAAGLGVALFLLPSGAATAAPKSDYTPGSDTATFTVSGVLDHNCLVSTGGTEIWIKPGDDINFKSSLVGVSVGDAVAGQTLGGLLNTVLQPSQVAGLDVTAQIYTGNSVQTVTVAGGNTTTFPSGSQTALSAGDHKITWQATGLALAPGVSGGSVPLSSSALQSGASLSWSGVIHVTKNAPQCKLAVSTPGAQISVGPVHVSVPPLNVSVPGVTLPTSLPTVPDLNPGSLTVHPPDIKKTSSGAEPSPQLTYKPPAMSVPQEVVPGPGTGGGGSSSGGSGGDGGFRLGVAGTDSTGQLAVNGTGSGSGSGGSNGTGSGSASTSGGQDGGSSTKPVDLASSASSPSGQLPVLLAILAVITLAMVAGIYARVYLLGRKSTTSS